MNWRWPKRVCIIGRMAMRSVPVVAVLLLGACDGDVLQQDEAGRWRVVARVADAVALRTAVAAAPRPTTVVAWDGGATDVIAAAAPARMLVVGDPVAAMPAGVDAVVVAETGAAVAVDLAVLACEGAALPPRILVGPRVLTAANVAAGGERRPAPGDLAAAMLRREHGDRFLPKAGGDAHVVAFVQTMGAWHDRVLAEVEAALASAPRIRLQHRSKAADGAWQALVRAAITNGARVVLVSTDDWQGLAEVVAVAQLQRVTVIAIDRTGTATGAPCVVGADQEAIGLALGEHLRAQQPDGAALIELGARGEDPAIARRRAGFARALGLRAP